MTPTINETARDKVVIPLMEMPWMAAILAIAAGGFDGYTYSSHHMFCTFQSGNVIMFGWYLAQDGILFALPYLISIGAFGFGAFSMVFVKYVNDKTEKNYTTRIIVFEIVIIALILIAINTFWKEHPEAGLFKERNLYVAWILAYVAGMQGQAFHKIAGMLYGNIAETLNVQLAFAYLGEASFGDKKLKGSNRSKSWDYAMVLIGFAIGSGVGSLLYHQTRADWQSYTLFWPLAVLVIILIIVRVFIKKYPDRPIDCR